MNIHIRGDNITVTVNNHAPADPFTDNCVHYVHDFRNAVLVPLCVPGVNGNFHKVDVPVRLQFDNKELVGNHLAVAAFSLVRTGLWPALEENADDLIWSRLEPWRMSAWWLSRFARGHMRWLPLGTQSFAKAANMANGIIKEHPWDRVIHPNPMWDIEGPGASHLNYVNGREEAV